MWYRDMHTYGTPDKVGKSPTTVHVLKDHYKNNPLDDHPEKKKEDHMWYRDMHTYGTPDKAGK